MKRANTDFFNLNLVRGRSERSEAELLSPGILGIRVTERVGIGPTLASEETVGRTALGQVEAST